MKRIFFVIFGIVLIGWILFRFNRPELYSVKDSGQLPRNTEVTDSMVDHTFKANGHTLVVIDGDIYVEENPGEYTFIKNYYDPDFFKKYYTVVGNDIYRRSQYGDGKTQVQVSNEYEDDFESYDTIQDVLISKDKIVGEGKMIDGVLSYGPDNVTTRWTSLTLQSPLAPEVADYVALRKEVGLGGDFLDNRLEPSKLKAHGGDTSIRAYAVKPSRDMVTSKSSFQIEPVHFTAGDDFWFSGWFYFEQGVPTTIMDLESSWLDGASGIRIILTEDGRPGVELKAFDKPTVMAQNYTLPFNKWIQVKAHFHLDPTEGLVELWFDDKKVINDSIQTLPLDDTVLDMVEVGISAAHEETVLYFDDVQVSNDPLARKGERGGKGVVFEARKGERGRFWARKG